MGLRERPLTEYGGFQSGPSLKTRGILELKIREKCIFCKEGAGSFSAAQVGKVAEQMYMFEKGRLSERFRSKKWSL